METMITVMNAALILVCPHLHKLVPSCLGGHGPIDLAHDVLARISMILVRKRRCRRAFLNAGLNINRIVSGHFSATFFLVTKTTEGVE
jgi:hypothetical protein